MKARSLNSDQNQHSDKKLGAKPDLKIVNVDKPKSTLVHGIEEVIASDLNSFYVLMKKCLHSHDKKLKKICCLIKTFVNEPNLLDLKKMLNQDEKLLFESVDLLDSSTSDEFSDIFGHFLSEMKKVMILQDTDESLSQLLASMDATKLVRFVKLYPEASGQVVSLLSPDILGDFFNQISKDEMVKILESTGQEAAEDVKDKLKEFLGSSDGDFERSLNSIIFELSDEKKILILESLIKEERVELARDISYQVLPDPVFAYVDPQWLKKAFSDIEVSDKINFLVILEQNDRDYWMPLMAEEGSKAKEMIDMEVDQLLSNESDLKDKLVKRKSIQETFYQKLRVFFKSENYRSIVKDAVDEWIKS